MLELLESAAARPSLSCLLLVECQKMQRLPFRAAYRLLLLIRALVLLPQRSTLIDELPLLVITRTWLAQFLAS